MRGEIPLREERPGLRETRRDGELDQNVERDGYVVELLFSPVKYLLAISCDAYLFIVS